MSRNICPCCNKECSDRTIRRHTAKLWQSEITIAEISVHDQYSTAVSASDDSGEIEATANVSSLPGGENIVAEELNLSHNHVGEMNVDHVGETSYNLDPSPPPAVSVPQTLCQNIPVTIEDWPKLPSDGSEVSDLNSDVSDEPVDSSDQDPPFVEVDYHADDPLDEAELTDEDLRRVAELHMIDDTIDDEEWMHLCW
ncbi:Type III restriction-modification system EcoP15I enzyme mod [Ceratobasidium theobromae]|uniref:Type III restriction-modification system EcoP15I enzyme mod n=1 Tax=Ceratobasidium theobromae TaxID=1582974 RepID=A0A5N5Q5Y2_9AGAM|nr:Type III restriction-modification system EcoP15I enzyme mod [Ceratobasidium theobromae]